MVTNHGLIERTTKAAGWFHLAAFVIEEDLNSTLVFLFKKFSESHSMDNSRRFFLRGKFSSSSQTRPPRPPWAVERDDLFIQKCTRCLECVDVCPTSVLAVGSGGFPEVSFQSNGCDECGKCVEACKPQALIKNNNSSAWSWQAQISDACLAHKQVECRVCGEFCDRRAIRFKPRLGGVSTPEVQLADCSGCGHCVSKCPTQAIQMQTPKAQ